MSDANAAQPASPVAERPPRLAEGRYLLGADSDFVDDEARVFVIDGVEVGVYRRADGLRAYQNFCPHQGGPVCEGLVLGKVEPVLDEAGRVTGERFSETEVHIICPWHGAEFDIDDGRCKSDRRMRLRRYDTVVEDGDVYLVV